MEEKAMSKMIKPFTYLKPNQCPACRGKLMLVEEESYAARLDSKGLPIGGDTYVEQRLVCTKCGSEYDCEKNGIVYQIAPKLPPIPVIIKDFNPFYQ